jgi:5-epi-alpha-selinene synthase
MTLGHNNDIPKISSVYCPMDAKIAPQVDEVQTFTNQWACNFRFLPHEQALNRFSRIKVANLTNRGYIGADIDMLKLVSCWLSYTFFLDDQAEKIEDPDQLQKFCSRFVAFLRSPTSYTTEGKGPLFEALGQLWNESLNLSPSIEWSTRFIRDLSEYFESNVWEAANKQSHRIPSLSEYLHHRQYTVAVYVYFDLYELAHQIRLPENVPEIEEITHMANNIISWFNDMISLEKELTSNDVHNLVLVIQNEEKCSLQAAMDRAVEMHNIEMERFLELETRLRSDFSQNTDVLNYLNGLRTCIRGNVDWSYESGRYVSGESKPEDLIMAYFTSTKF